MLVLIAVAAVFTWVVAPALPAPTRGYVLGALHVGLAAGLLHLLNSAFLASDQQAIHHVRGAWGESNTRDELGRARRRRLIWGWVDSISLRYGDIDHLVISRRGGVIAVDSKWRNSITRHDTVEMAQSARKAQRRAEGVVRTLLRKERGTHRARSQSISVTPVVVIWGAAQASVPEDAVVDGVRFVAGSEFLAWLRTVDGDPVPKAAANDVCRQLRAYRLSAWEGKRAVSAPRQTQPGKTQPAVDAVAARSMRWAARRCGPRTS